MSVALAEEAQIIHTMPGRLRVHLPGWSGQGERLLEAHVRQFRGVRRVQANALTHNILVQFDPQTLSEATLLAEIQQIDLTKFVESLPKIEPPHVATEKRGPMVRARIAVRGLDRDPQVGKQVLTRLAERPGVRAYISHLTGRVLVEFAEHEVELTDLLADIADVELPDVPGEDRPTYPLDPGPFLQGAMRTLGSGLGLSVLVARRLAGSEQALPAARAAAHAAGLIGLFQGLPPVRYGLRRLLGRTVADLLFNIPGIITLTLSSNVLGLAVSGVEALGLLTEVHARQAAWRLHEERIAAVPFAQHHAILQLEHGERAPLPAEVLEGTGTTIGRDGMPLALAQGALVPSGARVYGGPFRLKLQHEAAFEPFQPQMRTVPLKPDVYEYYQRIQAPISLGFAAITALLTRSFSFTLSALLLVNPRTAAIGIDNADLAASARVLRTGATIVGTRPTRMLRLPR
ncbi:MAG: haloacid dehalogenase, partial [Ktedonobacteraceae bacterium]